MRRSPPSRSSLPRLLKSTRTPRSCAVCPDLVWSSAPGSWQSSVTTGPAMRMPERDAAMPAVLRSLVRQALVWWSSRGSRRNRRLADALYLWAFCALTNSAGARAYYTDHRGRGHTPHPAIWPLANRLVGILHGCLEHRFYSETVAWPSL